MPQMDFTKIIEDIHLGDGVYASFDGWHLWLDLRSRPRTRTDLGKLTQQHICRIGLEPEVLDNLDEYRKAIEKAVQEIKDAHPDSD